MVEDWKCKYDKEINTLLWLEPDMMDNRCHIPTLRCSICTMFQRQLESISNLRAAFIEGSANVCESTIKDHDASNMHTQEDRDQPALVFSLLIKMKFWLMFWCLSGACRKSFALLSMLFATTTLYTILATLSLVYQHCHMSSTRNHETLSQ